MWETREQGMCQLDLDFAPDGVAHTNCSIVTKFEFAYVSLQDNFEPLQTCVSCG